MGQIVTEAQRWKAFFFGTCSNGETVLYFLWIQSSMNLHSAMHMLVTFNYSPDLSSFSKFYYRKCDLNEFSTGINQVSVNFTQIFHEYNSNCMNL